MMILKILTHLICILLKTTDIKGGIVPVNLNFIKTILKNAIINSKEINSKEKISGIYMMYIEDFDDEFIPFFIGSSSNVYARISFYKSNIKKLLSKDYTDFLLIKKSEEFYDIMIPFRIAEYLKIKELDISSLKTCLLEERTDFLEDLEDEWIDILRPDIFGFNVPQFVKYIRRYEMKVLYSKEKAQEILVSYLEKIYKLGIKYCWEIEKNLYSKNRYFDDNKNVVLEHIINRGLTYIENYNSLSDKNKILKEMFYLYFNNSSKSKNIVAYVDGSYEVKNNAYSSAALILDEEENVLERFTEEYADEYTSMRNVAGEVKSAMMAIKYAADNKYKEITIYFDYEGIQKWADKEWKANNPLTKFYQKYIDEKRKNLIINFVKVKSHTGVKYNEEVDQMAKNILGI